MKLNKSSSTQSSILPGFQNLAGFSHTLKQKFNKENEKDFGNQFYSKSINNYEPIWNSNKTEADLQADATISPKFNKGKGESGKGWLLSINLVRI